MSKKWPYFEIEYNGSNTFTTEMVEQALREGDINADQSATELFSNGLGPDKKVNGRQYLKTLDQHLKALEEHPEEYTRLYNLQYNINHYTVTDYENSKEIQQAEASIFIDEKTGEIKLDVEMFYPKGADLIIDDDKAIFDDSNLNTEKARALISLLKQNSLVDDLDDLKLHDADKDCVNWVNKAVEALKEEEEGKGHVRADIDNTPVSDEEFGDESSQAGSTGQNHSEAADTTKQGGLLSRLGFRRLSEAEQKELNAANEAFEKWLNKNKVKGRSWKLGHEGDWTVFTAFPNESRDPFRKLVETDRSGNIKYNYEFQIRTRIKNGKLEVEFSVPPGAKLNEDQAKLIASAFKDAGINYVEFGGMTDANAAAMRLGCAAKGVIPTSHKIDAKKYDKMLEAANDEMKNGPKFFKYKHDLALQVGKNLMATGIDWKDDKNKSIPECRRVRWAIGAYELYPFRNLWEDHGLRDSYEEKIAVKAMSEGGEQCSDAAYAVGAKMAVSVLYNMYGANRSAPVSVLLNGQDGSLNDREKLVLANALQTSNTSLDTKVYDVPPHVFVELYEEIFKTQYENAQISLENNFIKALSDARKYRNQDNPERTAIAKCADNAEISLGNMKNELEEFDIPKITIKNPKKYDYNFDEAYKKAERLGIINSSGRNYRRENDDNQTSDNQTHANRQANPNQNPFFSNGFRGSSR